MKKLNKSFFEAMKKTGRCENTDCKGKSKEYYQCILTKEFDNEDCIWCEDCCNRDDDMIAESQLIF